MISVVEPRAVGWVIAHFVLALAGVMLIPLGYALITGGDDLGALTLSVLVTAGAGGALFALSRSRPERELKLREGILVAVLVWASVCLFGALPFYFSPYFASFTDAFFESASGFTTTGATVLANVEVLSPPIQLWRHFSQWVGGMGIVLLGVAILPLLGQGGVHLYRAEFSGAKSEKLKPRIAETALSLYKLYMAFTVVDEARSST